jgi:putative flippase GtrA
LWAKVIATAFSAALNYVASAFFVFRDPAAKEDGEGAESR